jgi:Leucine-rich repeat (LRR) protein
MTTENNRICNTTDWFNNLLKWAKDNKINERNTHAEISGFWFNEKENDPWGIRLEDMPSGITQDIDHALSKFSILNINGFDLTEIPEDIGFLNGLTSINLSCNKLTTLPHTLTKLERLIKLKIDRNLF